MLYGFGTRRIFTPFMEPFVTQAGGKWHQYKDVEGNRYGKTAWYDWTLKDWLNEKEPGEPVVFGNLRGTADIIRAAEQNNINYYYFDHAYFYKANAHRADPIFKQRFYRITKNGEQLTKLLDYNKSPELIERINRFLQTSNIDINVDRKKGDKVLILPPTQFICTYYNLGTEDDWIKKTVNEIKKYTDREIIVRKKPEIGQVAPIPLEQQIKESYCVITYQSTAILDAVRYGVPVFCSEYSCALPVAKTDLSEIENPHYPTRAEVRKLIGSLLTAQFTEQEIITGVAKEIIDITQ